MRTLESRTVSEEKRKPVLDEQALAKLLEAAYVLQEHNREVRDLELRLELKRDAIEAEDRAQSAQTLTPQSPTTPAQSTPDYAQILAKIVEIQHHIQVRRLELENALKLVAERVAEMARASGAAIAIGDGKSVRYRAVAGRCTPPPGAPVLADHAICASCLKTGQVLRCSHVNTEFLLDPEECQRRGIESLIAVPVFHEGGVVGGLELYYGSPNAFTEQDVHTCQLMAGLVTEALAREEEASWKKSLATERAAMLQALEKLQPNLAALVGATAEKSTTPYDAAPGTTRAYACCKCGHQLVAEEQFCGQCGTPRATEPPNLQSKVASLWQMHEAHKNESAAASANPAAAEVADFADALPSELPLADSLEEQLSELFSDSSLNAVNQHQPAELAVVQEIAGVEVKGATTAAGVEEEQESPHNEPEASQGLTETALTHPGDWSSAASAREYLEQLVANQRQNAILRFWNSHRGDIYLGIAVILVACVIRWGIFSDHAVKATGSPSAATAQQTPPAAHLSLLDRILIQLGLAEAPEPPEDKGNPTVQVWVDLRTALYYCPGADLYGKTPKGKFTSQREAQMDQFQPAYRETCH